MKNTAIAFQKDTSEIFITTENSHAAKRLAEQNVNNLVDTLKLLCDRDDLKYVEIVCFYDEKEN